MNEMEVYASLTEIFRDVFMRDDMIITPELTAKDVPGWDSFKQIEIIIAVEEKYRIKFYTKELDSLNNVGDMAKFVEAKLYTK